MNLDLFALAVGLKLFPNDGTIRAGVPEPAFKPFELSWLEKTPVEKNPSDFSGRSSPVQDSPEFLAA